MKVTMSIMIVWASCKYQMIQTNSLIFWSRLVYAGSSLNRITKVMNAGHEKELMIPVRML